MMVSTATQPERLRLEMVGFLNAGKSDRSFLRFFSAMFIFSPTLVSASAMSFDFDGFRFNLVDTPGHSDFSEDTYRTLTAVDSAVMVIDAAKGIEAQTRKLFEVCRLRDIPIMTFVNKMDREARDPFELLDELSDQLQIETAPMVWPVGMGLNFKGVLDLKSDEFVPFGGGSRIGPRRGRGRTRRHQQRATPTAAHASSPR